MTAEDAMTENPTIPQRGRFVGKADLSYRRDGMEVHWPFTPDGLYDDWDAVNDLWKHAFK